MIHDPSWTWWGELVLCPGRAWIVAGRVATRLMDAACSGRWAGRPVPLKQHGWDLPPPRRGPGPRFAP
eukprot:15471761-Alexandrium_andersonii.AAC.1